MKPEATEIERVAVAVEALTTARFSFHQTVRIKGRDVPMSGDGLVDFRRDIQSARLSLNGRQIEHLNAGTYRFHKLSPSRQQATGKVWVLEKGCPYGNWMRDIFAALHQIASCTGTDSEVSAGERLRRYSFSIRPGRSSVLTRLRRKGEPPFPANLSAHLQAHGVEGLALDVWVGGDQTVRKIREHHTVLDLALLDGRTNIVTSTTEYTDFGIRVELAAPAADEVLGSEGESALPAY